MLKKWLSYREQPLLGRAVYGRGPLRARRGTPPRRPPPDDAGAGCQLPSVRCRAPSAPMSSGQLLARMIELMAAPLDITLIPYQIGVSPASAESSERGRSAPSNPNHHPRPSRGPRQRRQPVYITWRNRK